MSFQAARSLPRQRRPGVAGVLVGALGGIAAFFQLLPATRIPWAHRSPLLEIAVEAVSRAFVPVLRTDVLWLLSEGWEPRWAVLLLTGFALLTGCLVVAATVISLRSRRPLQFAFCGSLAGLFYLFAFKWFGGDHHAGLVFVLILTTLWLAWPVDPSPTPLSPLAPFPANGLGRLASVLLLLSFLISCVAGFDASAHDIARPFSGSADMAYYLRTTNLEHDPIAAYPDTKCEAVLPYLAPDVRFWFAGRQQSGSHMLWGPNWQAEAELAPEEVAKRVRSHFFARPTYLLFADGPLPHASELGFRLLFRTPAPVLDDESYYFYSSIFPTPSPSSRPIN